MAADQVTQDRLLTEAAEFKDKLILPSQGWPQLTQTGQHQLQSPQQAVARSCVSTEGAQHSLCSHIHCVSPAVFSSTAGFPAVGFPAAGAAVAAAGKLNCSKATVTTELQFKQ